MHQSQYDDLVAELTAREADLTAARATYRQLLSQQTASFEFNSGEASQRATLRKLENYQKQITFLENDVKRIKRELRGTANVRFVSGRRWQ